MLSTLRSKTGGLIAKIFIGLLAASFAVWGIEDMLRGRISDVIATVGDREIGSYEFNENFNRQLRVYSTRLGQTITPDRARELGIDRQILGDMMRQAALDSQADALGINMPELAVAQSVADNPRFQSSDGTFNADRFRQGLLHSGMTEQQFFAIERENMTRQVISQPLIAQAVVPETLVEMMWKHRNEQRDAKHFKITVETGDKQPSDADLKKLYDENPEAFREPERRTFILAVLNAETVTDQIGVTNQELQQQFEVRKKQLQANLERTVEQLQFSSEAEAKAARDKLDTGTSFEDIIKEQGKTLADVSLGTVKFADIPDEAIADAAFALKEGEVSQPVKGRFGTVLLRATNVGDGLSITIDALRDELTTAVKLRKARDVVTDLHDKYEDARAGGASLEEAAREIGITPVTINLVAENGSDEKGEVVTVPGNENALSTAFRTDTGLEIAPLTDGDSGFTWLETREIKQSFIPDFVSIKDKVADSWRTREAAKATRAKADAIVAKLKSGTSPEDVATEEGATISTATGVKRTEGGSGLTPAEVSALFSVKADGKTYALSNDGKSATILVSTPVLSTGYDSSSSEAQALRQVLAGNLSNDLYAEYVTALQEEIGVSIDDAAWERISSGILPQQHSAY